MQSSVHSAYSPLCCLFFLNMTLTHVTIFAYLFVLEIIYIPFNEPRSSISKIKFL